MKPFNNKEINVLRVSFVMITRNAIKIGTLH